LGDSESAIGRIVHVPGWYRRAPFL
jgi:hypothetical protein